MANEKLILPKSSNSVVGLLVKQRDPRSFMIDIQIEIDKVAKGMLDLRASINLMIHALYKDLDFGELKPMNMALQMANRSLD